MNVDDDAKGCYMTLRVTVAGFTKLHSSILHSTVWSADHATRIVWITMLAMADRDGVVSASVPGLARAANVSVDECEAALELFRQPDKYSRTSDFEGRRIEDVDGGWLVLNHARYRDIRTPEQVATAERVAKHREKMREKRGVTSNVTERNKGEITQSLPQRQRAEAEGRSKEQLNCGTSPRAPKPDELIDGVLVAMRDAIQELNPKSHGPRDTPQNRKLIRGPVKACAATLDDWRTVIRRQLESVRSKPETRKYLSLATLGRPVNFQRILDADDAPSEAWKGLLS